MRLDDPGRDQQVRIVCRLVHGQRDAIHGAEVDQHSRTLRLVVDHTVPGHDRFAKLVHLFLARAGPVHTRAAEQRNILVTYAGTSQLSQQRRNDQVVWACPRHVGEDDARRVARSRYCGKAR